jgi:hypothetical protein
MEREGETIVPNITSQTPPTTVMVKETVVREDGRLLIYYRFVPANPGEPPANQKASR